MSTCPKCNFVLLPGQPCGMCKVKRSNLSRRNRQQGETTQEIAGRELVKLGLLMPERVHTPWGIRRVRGRIVSAHPLEKVSGDWRGLLFNGRSVLVEVKSRTERDRDHVLQYGDLEPHQRTALTEHSAHGGLSLLCWVRLHPAIACYVLSWDALTATGFRARTSISVEQAKAMSLRALC